MAVDPEFQALLDRVIADNDEVLRRLADPDGDVRLPEQAKIAYAKANSASWVEYTAEDLEELRRQYVALDAKVDEDFFVEDEPARGVGWCAPSP